MGRKLFCEWSPLTYAISVKKERMLRRVRDALSPITYAEQKEEALPILVYSHNSLIRRKLGNVDMRLQENKAINLSLSAPHVNGILIRPGETFSFWHLVGHCTAKKGYQEGMTILIDHPSKDIGGGMCQFTNLLHWLVLHSPLEIVEHHHHDGVDLFPDFGRVVPFGCGTSIMYNYLDYRVKNTTENTFQFIVYTSDTHLCGELRAQKPLDLSYHVEERDLHFVKLNDTYYRRNAIVRNVVDKRTGDTIESKVIKESNARVLYSDEYIDKALLRAE